VIEPTLPLGLAAAQANIQGLDANPLTKAKIELGRQLYFDTRLSSDGTISCASCHHPDEGYGAHTQFGVGVDGQTGNRNSPVSYNRIVSGPQFWDGRVDSLEAQAVGPIANPIEMGNTHEQAVATLKEIPGYKMQFDKVFPDEGVTIDAVGKAIAAFERVIVTDTAPYDHYEILRTMQQQFGDEIEDLKEEDPELYARYQTALEGSSSMSDSAKRGRELFFSDRVGCTACHAGANFTDELYHNLGVGMDAEEPDLGRFVVTKKEEDKGAFKTPTLRNVALSAPYMHDGSQATLEEVMEWYDKGGHPNPHLSDKVKKLDLTEEEEADLIAFMKEALTSSFPEVCRDRLPQ
jgi:cytochrome c peroxidase